MAQTSTNIYTLKFGPTLFIYLFSMKYFYTVIYMTNSLIFTRRSEYATSHSNFVPRKFELGISQKFGSTSPQLFWPFSKSYNIDYRHVITYLQCFLKWYISLLHHMVLSNSLTSCIIIEIVITCYCCNYNIEYLLNE